MAGEKKYMILLMTSMGNENQFFMKPLHVVFIFCFSSECDYTLIPCSYVLLLLVIMSFSVLGGLYIIQDETR